MATLINGNGNPAIYAQQDADFYNGIMGPRTRILNVGSKMAATIEDANTIAIADGVIITKEGRRVQVDVGNVDEFIIPTGQAGTTRYYIIGYHLYTDGSANQLCETFVQLMASGSETITEDEFREGATEVYVSLYRIEQTGLTLNDPEALLTVGDSVSQIEDDIDDIEGDIAQINSDLTELSDTQEVTLVSSENFHETCRRVAGAIDLSKITTNTYIYFDNGLIISVAYMDSNYVKLMHLSYNSSNQLEGFCFVFYIPAVSSSYALGSGFVTSAAFSASKATIHYGGL